MSNFYDAVLDKIAASVNDLPDLLANIWAIEQQRDAGQYNQDVFDKMKKRNHRKMTEIHSVTNPEEYYQQWKKDNKLGNGGVVPDKYHGNTHGPGYYKDLRGDWQTHAAHSNNWDNDFGFDFGNKGSHSSGAGSKGSHSSGAGSKGSTHTTGGFENDFDFNFDEFKNAWEDVFGKGSWDRTTSGANDEYEREKAEREKSRQKARDDFREQQRRQRSQWERDAEERRRKWEETRETDARIRKDWDKYLHQRRVANSDMEAIRRGGIAGGTALGVAAIIGANVATLGSKERMEAALKDYSTVNGEKDRAEKRRGERIRDEVLNKYKGKGMALGLGAGALAGIAAGVLEHGHIKGLNRLADKYESKFKGHSLGDNFYTPYHEDPQQAIAIGALAAGAAGLGGSIVGANVGEKMGYGAAAEELDRRNRKKAASEMNFYDEMLDKLAELDKESALNSLHESLEFLHGIYENAENSYGPNYKDAVEYKQQVNYAHTSIKKHYKKDTGKTLNDPEAYYRKWRTDRGRSEGGAHGTYEGKAKDRSAGSNEFADAYAKAEKNKYEQYGGKANFEEAKTKAFQEFAKVQDVETRKAVKQGIMAGGALVGLGIGTGVGIAQANKEKRDRLEAAINGYATLPDGSISRIKKETAKEMALNEIEPEVRAGGWLGYAAGGALGALAAKGIHGNYIKNLKKGIQDINNLSGMERYTLQLTGGNSNIPTLGGFVAGSFVGSLTGGSAAQSINSDKAAEKLERLTKKRQEREQREDSVYLKAASEKYPELTKLAESLSHAKQRFENAALDYITSNVDPNSEQWYDETRLNEADALRNLEVKKHKRLGAVSGAIGGAAGGAASLAGTYFLFGRNNPAAKKFMVPMAIAGVGVPGVLGGVSGYNAGTAHGYQSAANELERAVKHGDKRYPGSDR